MRLTHHLISHQITSYHMKLHHDTSSHIIPHHFTTYHIETHHTHKPSQAKPSLAGHRPTAAMPSQTKPGTDQRSNKSNRGSSRRETKLNPKTPWGRIDVAATGVANTSCKTFPAWAPISQTSIPILLSQAPSPKPRPEPHAPNQAPSSKPQTKSQAPMSSPALFGRI